MKVTVLSENEALGPGLAAAHGLSLYIETDGGALVFDFGPDDGFIKNARALGIDLSRAERAVLSHGHYDHGGGLSAFLSVNARAPVYARQNAFEPHFSDTPEGPKYNGLDAALSGSPRIVKTGRRADISPGLTLFAREPGALMAGANASLLCAGGVRDDFSHEQSLIIREAGGWCLFAGCAHTGIADIVMTAAGMEGCAPRAVVAGFHMTNPRTGAGESEQYIRAVAGELSRYSKTRWYTCHCTGARAAQMLSALLPLERICTGSVIEI